MRIAARRLAAIKTAWPTEAALCDAFAALARAQGYVVHAECSDWDLVLVDGAGLQIGIEAKQQANLEVLAQAIGPRQTGPDIHGVLVPWVHPRSSFGLVARTLGIVTIHAALMLDGRLDVAAELRGAQRWYHDAPLWTPPCEIVAMGGGRPAPVRITPWKVAAMQLCKTLRSHGFLLRRDFTALRISPTWWVTGSDAPLRCERAGKHWRYVATGKPLPDERWPDVAAALGKV